MSGEAKVLNGLLQRRALEEAFAELGRLHDPAEIQRQAQAIAQHGSAALQHLLTLLDTPDPQLRGGLGQVARHLPRERVVPALRAVARGQDRSDQARLAAVTLLERFLGEPIDDALIAHLNNPDSAARQSLRELVAAMDDEPLSVVEYLEQLGQQPPEVIQMVLDALPAVEPNPHLTTLLRMLAQGGDAHLARRALDELAKQRTPAALRALTSLAPNLPPALAPIADRSARKLRFSGISVDAEHDPQREPWYAPGLTWRVLMSPVDPQGGQFLWFVGRAEGGANAVFFTVLVQDPGGLRDASGSLDASADHAPPRRRTGAIHFIVGDGSAPGLTLLEAPLALGYATLKEALARNWAAGEPAPVGYRLFSPLIWTAAEESGEVEDIAPDLSLEPRDLAALLGQPLFFGWLQGLASAVGDPDAIASFSRRFKSMSRWLSVGGEEASARAAATFAYHLDGPQPQVQSILAAASGSQA